MVAMPFLLKSQTFKLHSSRESYIFSDLKFPQSGRFIMAFLQPRRRVTSVVLGISGLSLKFEPWN